MPALLAGLRRGKCSDTEPPYKLKANARVTARRIVGRLLRLRLPPHNDRPQR